MKVTRADMDLCAAVLSRRFARFLPDDRKAPQSGLFAPHALIHSAINARAGVRLSGAWGNAVALLRLVRSNQSRGAYQRSDEPRTLFEYLQAHAYSRSLDASRARVFRRILSRGLRAWRYT